MPVNIKGKSYSTVAERISKLSTAVENFTSEYECETDLDAVLERLEQIVIIQQDDTND